MADIHKAAGIIIRDKRLLVERSKGKDFFISPGGSIELGETPAQALVRELKEEFQINTLESDFKEFGIFTAQAANDPAKTVHMRVYLVERFEGEPRADNEVEEIRWVTTKDRGSTPIGSIFAHEVMPRLAKEGLID